MKTSGKSKLLLIAATISWFWAVLMALTAIGVVLPSIFTFKLPSIPVIGAALLLFIIAACFALTGYGIRKQKKPSQVMATIWLAFVLGSELIMQGNLSFIGGTSCIMLGLVLVNWKRFI
ncbi:MAG: hypothetical protein PHN82_02550 [bacterium]|nr:hypothetical protein [bacterium]